MNMSQLSSAVARIKPSLKREPSAGSRTNRDRPRATNAGMHDGGHASDSAGFNNDAFQTSLLHLSVEDNNNTIFDDAHDNSMSAGLNVKTSPRHSNAGLHSVHRPLTALSTISDASRTTSIPPSDYSALMQPYSDAGFGFPEDEQASGGANRSRLRRRLAAPPGIQEERKSAARQKELIEAKRLRKRLKFFFLNPVEKFRTRGQFPYKLFMQLVKVFFVTAQLLMFGDMRYQYVNFLRQNKLAFGKMLLQNWTESYDPEFVVGPIPYQYAIETYDQFYDGLNYAVVNYRHLGRDALGTYDYGDANASFGNRTYLGGDYDDTPDESTAKVPPMQFCKHFYKEAHLYPNNSTYILNTDTATQCIFLKVDNVHNYFDAKTFFRVNNFSINFDTIITAKLLAVVRTVHVRRDFDPYQRPPVCYKLEVKISFDNTGHCGRIPVTISLTPESMNCKGNAVDDSGSHTVVTTILDIIVFIICGLSFFLCVRAIIRSIQLKRCTDRFLCVYLNYRMPMEERVEFMNGWYLMICFNDIMILLGTFIKLVIQSDYRAKTTSDYDQCGILLGIGNLLVWCGILRYLTFFKKYNILLLTLKRATPNVVRFMVCALCIFLGFSFCGWLVFGPYHYKFHSWPSSCEVLFAEINGDDMYTTFATIGDQVSPSVWISFRVYLYVFIVSFAFLNDNVASTTKYMSNNHFLYVVVMQCLFTYVVLSLFISLIMEAYETVKDYQKNGQPMSPLHCFVWQGLPPDSEDIVDADVGSVVYVRSRLPSFSAADEQAAHDAVVEQNRRKRRARAASTSLLGRAWIRLSHSRCVRCLCREDDWDASDREDLQPTSSTHADVVDADVASRVANANIVGISASRPNDLTASLTTMNTVPVDGFPSPTLADDAASPTHRNNYGTLS